MQDSSSIFLTRQTKLDIPYVLFTHKMKTENLKDVYNPDEDPENFVAASETNSVAEEAEKEGFEIPDYLKDVDEDLFKIE